jgi:hypothetical protein
MASSIAGIKMRGLSAATNNHLNERTKLNPGPAETVKGTTKALHTISILDTGLKEDPRCVNLKKIGGHRIWSVFSLALGSG